MKIAALTARHTVPEIGLVISDGPAQARPFSEKSRGGELSLLIAVQRSRDCGKYRAYHDWAMPDNERSPAGKSGARVKGSTGKGAGGPA